MAYTHLLRQRMSSIMGCPCKALHLLIEKGLTYILVHLVADLHIEALTLLTLVFLLTLSDLVVLLDLIVVLLDDYLVEALLLGHSLLMALQGALPGIFLHWVRVLDHTRVPLWLHVAAIVERLHLCCHNGSVLGQTITSDLNLAIQGRCNCRVSRCHALCAASVTAWALALSFSNESLALGD